MEQWTCDGCGRPVAPSRAVLLDVDGATVVAHEGHQTQARSRVRLQRRQTERAAVPNRRGSARVGRQPPQDGGKPRPSRRSLDPAKLFGKESNDEPDD